MARVQALIAVVFTLFAISCTTVPQTPPPASTPPPVPPRPDRVALITGSVVDVNGVPVAGADVSVAVGDDQCRPSAQRLRTTTRANGSFSLEPDIGMGAPESRCVFIEASGGGSTARAEQRRLFTSGFPEPVNESDKIRLELSRPQALTVEAANRIVDLFTRAMSSHDPELFRELATYIGDVDTLVQTLSDFGSSLRGITSAEMIRPYVYRLTGRTGQQATIEITNDSLTRIKGELIEASPRARALIRSVFDVIERNDAERLAAVLQKSSAEARDIIERWRAMNLRDERPTLRTIDEAAQTLSYAVGNARIEVGYGNNTVWIRSM